mmetsp:Transcript_36635/g.105412  ORF Transcript_36635/g.105412 Transcript_36635/m.105412 type:complete len:205 (-) Transcript_36635:143-757(-)
MTFSRCRCPTRCSRAVRVQLRPFSRHPRRCSRDLRVHRRGPSRAPMRPLLLTPSWRTSPRCRRLRNLLRPGQPRPRQRMRSWWCPLDRWGTPSSADRCASARTASWVPSARTATCAGRRRPPKKLVPPLRHSGLRSPAPASAPLATRRHALRHASSTTRSAVARMAPCALVAMHAAGTATRRSTRRRSRWTSSSRPETEAQDRP